MGGWAQLRRAGVVGEVPRAGHAAQRASSLEGMTMLRHLARSRPQTVQDLMMPSEPHESSVDGSVKSSALTPPDWCESFT